MAPMMTPLTQLSESEKSLWQWVQEWSQKELKPKVAQMDETESMDPQIIKQLFELGIMGIEIPEAYGGTGANFLSSCLVIEAIAQVDPAVAVLVDVQNTLVNNALIRWGSPQQKEKYLPQLATQSIGAYALSEAQSGSDAFSLQTRAQKEGSFYILTGQKLWITNAQEADLFIVFANVDPSLGYRGITAFLVEKGQSGFFVGKKEKKLGIRASSTCELILDGVKVPESQILGAVGQGYKVAIETLNEGRIGIGAQMIGLAMGAYEVALRYSWQRQQFGQPIAQFQGIQMLLAQMRTQIEAGRLLVYNAARLKEAGLPFRSEAAMAKYFASQVAEFVASKAVEILGGNGFTREYPVEKFYRDAKIGSIYEGTTHMQLLTIAKSELARARPENL